MKVLSAVLTLLVLLMSSKAYSQVPFPSWAEIENLSKNTALDFPKWTSMGDLACYNLEGAKLLKKYQAECTGAKEKLTLIKPLMAKYVESLNAYDKATSILQESLKQTRIALKKQVAISDRSELLRQEAEYWSITGNMLPWVITGATVLFFSGYLTAELAH